MQRYFLKTPWLVKKIFSDYIWSLPAADNAVYLTFDDGPHPQITPWVLDELKKGKALATFFCIGKNVVQYPSVYQRILAEGHAVGNHTYHHVNGWKTPVAAYVDEVKAAAVHIKSSLFRPPYGKIKPGQAKQVRKALNSGQGKIIMWDVLSADFDKTVTPEQCLKNVLSKTTAGSVIVFHDSEKAFGNMSFCLPKVLQRLSEKSCLFRKIEEGNRGRPSLNN